MTYLQPPNLHQTVTKKDYPAADKNRFVFNDEFIGSAEADTYIWASTGGGTIVKSAAAGGILQIEIDGRNATHTIDFGGKLCVKGINFDMTFIIAISLGNTDVVPEFGLIHVQVVDIEGVPTTVTEKVSFRYNKTGPSWDLITHSGTAGAITINNAGTPDTDFHKFRAVKGVSSTGSAQVIFYIDGAVIASSTTNLPTGIMQPFVTITNPGKNITSNIYVDLITFSGVR